MYNHEQWKPEIRTGSSGDYPGYKRKPGIYSNTSESLISNGNQSEEIPSITSEKSGIDHDTSESLISDGNRYEEIPSITSEKLKRSGIDQRNLRELESNHD